MVVNSCPTPEPTQLGGARTLEHVQSHSRAVPRCWSRTRSLMKRATDTSATQRSGDTHCRGHSQKVHMPFAYLPWTAAQCSPSQVYSKPIIHQHSLPLFKKLRVPHPTNQHPINPTRTPSNTYHPTLPKHTFDGRHEGNQRGDNQQGRIGGGVGDHHPNRVW